MQFSPFDPEQHVQEVLRLYKRAIRGLDEGLYDARQRLAWSAWGNEPRRAARLLAQGQTLLAFNNTQLLGFAQLLPVDCINMLYVDPAHGRQGVGAALVAEMEARAMHSGVVALQTRASRASQPLFARMGFTARREEWVQAQGVSLPRRLMVKPLSPRG